MHAGMLMKKIRQNKYISLYGAHTHNYKLMGLAFDLNIEML